MVLLLTALALLASDWPEWRGPHRDGVVLEEPKAWPEKLALKWKTEVGIGHSSPVMAAGSIYEFTRQGDQETVLSIDPASGKIRWKQQYPAPYKMNPAAVSHGEGPKSTPVYSKGKLYTFGINGILSAFDAETGKPLWRHDFKSAPDFGTAMSPVVDNGLLIAHVGALTAFDAATGAVKWAWNGDSPAYASPIVVELGGVRQVVTQTHSNIVGVAVASGKLLWKIPFTTEYDQNIVTPVLYKDTLIFSGIDKGVFAVRDGKTIWQNKGVSMYMSSPVLVGDLLFGFSHLKKGQIFCLDAGTGATLWTGPPRGGDNAAMLASSTMLYWLTPDGQLGIAKPTAKGLNEIRQYEVAESPTWAHPVVLGDGVLVKDLKSLVRWGVN
ncbi:MAG TPA: PQQ-binding-like beta-propeller repeat protein [Bryobacteraceae bacterium]|jgi:outer membrane protein assembly factor BamB|nr:PQQ-binding-like beta-propeller repeat protein [Bryobacteraceae bacterium]